MRGILDVSLSLRIPRRAEFRNVERKLGHRTQAYSPLRRRNAVQHQDPKEGTSNLKTRQPDSKHCNLARKAQHTEHLLNPSAQVCYLESPTQHSSAGRTAICHGNLSLLVLVVPSGLRALEHRWKVEEFGAALPHMTFEIAMTMTAMKYWSSHCRHVDLRAALARLRML